MCWCVKMDNKIKTFIDRIGSSNKVLYWHISEKRFYLKKPDLKLGEYIEIGEWSNVPASKDLWIKIRMYNQNVILKATEIEALAKSLEWLKHSDIWKI